MKKREFWFVVGSQSLYGQEVLDTVDARQGDGGVPVAEAPLSAGL